MDGLYLSIFPQGGLSQSVITTIWIGVIITGFFNLRFGWVMSGLVVPGYLVPLLLVKPFAVVVIFLESFVTYFLVYLFSEVGSKSGYWSNLFGRDRFFAILIVSVLVRVVFDGWLMPLVGQTWVDLTGIAFDYKNHLHSFGLIIVALLANIFWKPGIVKGILPLTIIIGLTFLIVRFMLIEYTNFNLSSLSYMYENISSNILASPKSYIILLTVAFIASRMNLYYGWDFNGILIPALLALQWYQPEKIFISLGEAVIIIVIAFFILKIPFFKNSNIEGARKIILFFNIGFIYKIFLSALIIKYLPQLKVTDYFGFGYLLSTLIAIKIHDKGRAPLFFRATIQTSLIATIIAVFIGYALSIAGDYIATYKTQKNFSQDTSQTIIVSTKKLDELLGETQIHLYENSLDYSVPTPEKLDSFQELILKISSDTIDNSVATLASKSGFELYLVESRYILLKSKPNNRFSTFVIDLKSKSDLFIAVLYPLNEWRTFESGIWLFKEQKAKSLSIYNSYKDNEFKKISQRYSYEYIFHSYFGKKNTLQVRGYTSENTRLLFEKRLRPYQLENTLIQNSIFVKNRLPKALDISNLKKDIGEFKIYWSQTNIDSFNKNLSENFAEIFLTRDARTSILSKSFLKQYYQENFSYQSISGYFQQWILNEKNTIAQKGSEKYVIPSTGELLFFDKEILTPLISFAQKYTKKSDKKELEAIGNLANLIGYEIIHYRHLVTNEDYFLLLEKTTDPKFRGTFVIRAGKNAKNTMIQIPRPIKERNTFEFGVSIFERTQSRALLISGAHPEANIDKSSDLLIPTNKNSFFTLASQIFFREFTNSHFSAIQCRAFGGRDYVLPPNGDIVLSYETSPDTKESLPETIKDVLNLFKKDGIKTVLVDGSASTAGYEVSGNLQSLYLDYTTNKSFSIVWISSELRSYYKTQEDDSQMLKKLQSIGITGEDKRFRDFFISFVPTDTKEEVKKLLKQYIQTNDVLVLYKLQSMTNLKFFRDFDTKRVYLYDLDKNNQTSFVLKTAVKNNLESISTKSLAKEELLSWIYKKEPLFWITP